MRRLLRFLLPDRPPPRPVTHVSRANTAAYYRSAAHLPLTAPQVRDRQFPGVRHGLDPEAVYAFLHRVADELAAARNELARTRDENVRIKHALRDWQSRFTQKAHG